MNGGRLRGIEPSLRHSTAAAMAPAHGFRVKSRLISLDSTTISLCLGLFPLARFRTTKGAIKLHTLLDYAGYIPAFVVITTGKEIDVVIARGLRLAQGRIMAMDRGDLDDRFLFCLQQNGVYFVTRQKVNARVKVTARFVVDRAEGVTSDHNVILVAQKSAASPQYCGGWATGTQRPAGVTCSGPTPSTWQPRRLSRSTNKGGRRR
jgi:hypothetical protein